MVLRRLRIWITWLRRRVRARTKTLWNRGARGELFARVWLWWRGCLIWETNWRCRRGEIDIIASVGRTLLICEVKTRSQRSADFLRPAAAVDDEKLDRLHGLAKIYQSRRLGRVRQARIKRYQVVTIEVIETARGIPVILSDLHEPLSSPSTLRSRGASDRAL